MKEEIITIGIPKAERKFLRPKNQPVKLLGKMTYSEGYGANNVIRLPHKVLEKFRELYEKRSKFGCEITLYPSFLELRKNVVRMEKSGEVPPLTMRFFKIG